MSREAVDLLPLAAGAEQNVDTGGAGLLDKGQLNGTCLGFHFSRRLCLPWFPCHVLLIKLQLA